ncbi:MAG: protein kinase [Myxococcota bacterium]
MASATASLPDDLPARIGTVRITTRLGGGGMGEVYAGEDEELGRVVAVKLLSGVTDEEAAERFEREALALARLSHPNVVQVYSKGVWRGRPYFAMELVDGPSVLDVLSSQGPFSVEEAVEVVRQAALGLRAAAQAGVIHRDVKPANLLVAPDGTVKVADFGVCKIAGRSPAVTEAGTTLGTPFYMAPEQARGETVDARADIYALGASLFHLLTGRTPYAVNETVAQLLAHQREPVPDVAQACPGLPRGMVRLIRRMLQKDPAARPQDYDELLAELDEALLPPPRRTGWYVAGGVVASLLLGLPAWWWWQRPTTEPVPPAPVTTVEQPAPPPAAPPPVVLASEAPRGNEPDTPPVSTERPNAEALKGDAVEALLARIRGPRAPDRAAAMASLARTRDERARPALEAILRDKQDPDGPLAAVLLGELGDQAATEALIAGLRSERRATVLAAVDALSALRDVRAVEPLRQLAESHADPTIRTRARKAGTALFAIEGDR